ncbi:MAG: response regulator [Anaerolineae bacterium]|nr:response regulator [Anaerolineae bacterium]
MKRKRILIVDDESRVAFFLQEGLKGLGDEYDVQAIGSAELALEQIHKRPFDLLVVDFRLPGINGLDLIKRVRNVNPGAKMILITAYGSPEIESEARQLDISRYLHKPFRIQELMHTVQGILA